MSTDKQRVTTECPGLGDPAQETMARWAGAGDEQQGNYGKFVMNVISEPEYLQILQPAICGTPLRSWGVWSIIPIC